MARGGSTLAGEQLQQRTAEPQDEPGEREPAGDRAIIGVSSGLRASVASHTASASTPYRSTAPGAPVTTEAFPIARPPSPSANHILINGVDPFAAAGQSPAYACRVYATPAGLSGVPPLDDVTSALTAASNREPISPG